MSRVIPKRTESCVQSGSPDFKPKASIGHGDSGVSSSQFEFDRSFDSRIQTLTNGRYG